MYQENDKQKLIIANITSNTTSLSIKKRAKDIKMYKLYSNSLSIIMRIKYNSKRRHY